MKTTMTPEKALLKLADLCSTGEHCKWEMCEKLRKWGIQRSDADKIIAKLSEGKFIDDRRFTRAFVHDRITFRKQGRRMIMRDLILKRIDKDIITDALADIDRDQYADNLTTLMARKLLSLGGDINDNDIRNRLVRFAAGRGYEPSLIFNTLESLK
ncbi:MAG: regulatory protein RecX [Muribaculaceae bacterium]